MLNLWILQKHSTPNRNKDLNLARVLLISMDQTTIPICIEDLDEDIDNIYLDNDNCKEDKVSL